MKKLLLAGLAGVALAAAGSANAADIGVSPVYSPPSPVFTPVPYFTWMGPYIGVNGGGGWENTRTQYSYSSKPVPPESQTGFEDVFGPNSSLNSGGPGPLNEPGQSAVASAIARGFLPTSLGKKGTGFFTAGGQIGMNFQMAQIVYGLEADIEWVGGTKKSQFSTTINIPNDGFISNSVTQTAGLRWLSTFRARAGYAINRLLIFATVGGGIGRVAATTDATGFDGTNTDIFSGSGSSYRAGLVAGGGLEYALTDYLTVKGEYLYYNLGSANYQVLPINSVAKGEGLTIKASQKFDGSIFRAGLNFKFDWL